MYSLRFLVAGRRGRTIATICIAALGVTLSATPAVAGNGPDTVWLCKPGLEPNPCRGSLETTVDASDGQSHVVTPARARKPKIDCFYVYPTVSEQPGPNADLTIDPQQIAIAEYQAARFSQRCRVYAPLYKQLTLSAISSLPAEQAEAAIRLAYASVRSAWRDYLANHNRGRGFVLIGHSQGSGMLTALLRDEIETRPAVSKRMVSALLLGFNVSVKKGKDLGGSFRKVPACRSPRQTGCVIAYSTYNQPPPDDTLFGKPSQWYAEILGAPYGPKIEVLCNNPASLAGGAGTLRTYLRSEPFPGLLGLGLMLMFGGPPPTAPTPWLKPQDRYSGKCVRANGANVLMLSPIGSARMLNPSPDATWGLHLADVNIALGDLIATLRSQTRAYLQRQG